MRWRRRIERIRKAHHAGLVFYRLPDGTVKGVSAKRQLDVFIDACEGRDTPAARLMLQAEQCVYRGGGRLHELAQSLTEPAVFCRIPLQSRAIEPKDQSAGTF